MNQKTRKAIEDLAAWLEKSSLYPDQPHWPYVRGLAQDMNRRAKALRELLRRN